MRLNALKKFTNYNKIILIAVIVMASFFIAPQTFASWQETVVGGIFFLLIGGLGLILSLVIKVLLMVASYQNFIGSQAVIQGWVIVRDLSNMFFVVILLVIAFATILHIESYNYKKWLPKLILMAVLINFSKTICGLLIDVAQIVMLTFVNSFKDVAAGNFVDMMGIKEIVTFQKETGKNVFWTLMGAYMLGLIYMIIAVVVLTTMLMILVMRMVMIWIYVVLSPLAYLLSAFPGGATYASKWWKDFISNLIVGPVLAFFIWLSFAALQTSESAADLAAFEKSRINDGIVISGEGNEALNTGSGSMMTKASEPSVFIKFIIGIGMLIGGLKIAQEVGGAAGSIAGKGMNKLSTMGAATAGGIGGFALGRARWAGRNLDSAQVAAQKKFGIKKPMTLNPTLIKKAYKEYSEESKSKYYESVGNSGEWQDAVTKYMNPKQYFSLRKSKKSRTEDTKEATRISTQTNNEEAILNNREQLLNLPESKRAEKFNDYQKPINKDKIIADYIKLDVSNKTDAEKKQSAELNYIADIEALDPTLGTEQAQKDEITAQKNVIKARKDEENKKIDALNDPRLRVGRRDGKDGKDERLGVPLGFNKHVYKPSYGMQASQERADKMERELNSNTKGDSFALVDQLIKAINEKDSTRAAMSFKLLAKNNDLNEASKDPRLIRLMTKSNGILSKMAKQGLFGTEAKKDVNIITEDYARNPVDPVYVQSMIQGILAEAGSNNDLAARQANDIGHTSFAAGSGVAYGIAEGNSDSGDFEFSKINYEKGKGLKAEESRVKAMVGKLNTSESQSKMRSLHPNTILIEGADSKANGLSDTGVEFLKTVTSLDLGHMNRVRPDLLKKFGDSRKSMQQAIQLADELASSGDEAQANNIKYFIGYIQSRKNAKQGVKDFTEVSRAFEEAKAENA